jgi:glyoxylase-like metal-dependent hydrolase (beta-lactamase superfamily II)
MKTALLLPLFALICAAQMQDDIEVIHVRGNVYMLASDDGNVTVQVGTYARNDGMLLVDTGSPKMTARIAAELRKLGNQNLPLRYIVNTSGDVDHVSGNGPLAKPDGIRPFNGVQAPDIAVYAQDNVLTRVTAKDSGIAETHWPSMTFTRQKDFTFDGEAVQIISEAPAHTDGDAIVFFRGSNVISTGEIFRTTGYPVIDLARGGSIQGEIRALNHIIDLAVPDMLQEGGTMIIPGHGRLCDESDIVDYRDMVTIVRDRVADQIKKGKSLEQVKAAKLTLDYDGRFSQPSWTGDMFVEAIYKSLKQDQGGEK